MQDDDARETAETLQREVHKLRRLIEAAEARGDYISPEINDRLKSIEERLRIALKPPTLQ